MIKTKTCWKCGGVMKIGKALVDCFKSVCGVLDFPGDNANTRGQTFTIVPDGSQMVNCFKCEKCGHSIA